MNILFFIGTLSTGGAERQTSVLAKGMAERGHNVSVVTLFPGGQLAKDLNGRPGIELRSLWKKKSCYFIIRLIQLAAAPLVLRRSIGKVDCLYSMLEVTNFIAWLATRFGKNTCLIWGIRSSNMEDHWKMALFDKLCSFVSPSIKLIIVNSHEGLECLIKRGYHPQKYTVIPNGIDTNKFQYDEELRRKVRQELGVSSSHPLIGIVGRLDPMKDYPTFLKAAMLVASEVDNVKFLCVGGGVGNYVEELHELANELGLKDRVIWLGNRSDMVAIYSALDILVSSSAYGEGFSNVIGEAMSCGISCVVTDVGDSARIVGESCRIVEPKKAEMLAQVICKTHQRKKTDFWTANARSRIEEKFSLKKLIDRTEQILGKSCAVD